MTMNILNKGLGFGNLSNGIVKEERPKDTLWLNIGCMLDGEFVTLPVNLGIENMKPRKLVNNKTDSQKELNKRITAQNALLKALQDKCASLDKGEAITLSTLQVQLYRAEDNNQEEALAKNDVISKAVYDAVFAE